MERACVEPAGNKAVFLDRDGTIIKDVGYLSSRDDVDVPPGAAAALRRLRSAGFLLLVVTNQSAIARGLLTESQLAEIHGRLQELLSREGVQIDEFFYCPHLPAAPVARYATVCSCRKPEPGLLLEAAAKWQVSLACSFAVGDSERDVEAGCRAGCHSILISQQRPKHTCALTVVADLSEAADVIIGAGKGSQRPAERSDPARRMDTPSDDTHVH